MSKLVVYPELFLEETELNRMIRFLGQDGFRKLLTIFTDEFGIVKRNRDGTFTALQVYNSSSGKVGVRAGEAFTSAGDLIQLTADVADILTIPDDNTYRKVFIQYATTQIEQGTLQLNTNGTIVGTNTNFDEILKAGKRIEIINSTQGNNGTYNIVSVTDATNLEADATFVAESGVQYKIKGVYTPSVSIPDGESRPFYLDSVNITLESDATSQSDVKFCLGRVKNDGGVITIVDVRDKIHLLKKPWEGEFDKQYTTSPSFYVNGAPGSGGKRVLTVSDQEAQTPINFRLVDIYGHSNYIQTNEKQNVSKEMPKGDVNRLFVYFKWGYDDITGVGYANGDFDINNVAYDDDNYFLADALNNQWIFIPGAGGGNFRINDTLATASGVTKLSLLDENGDAPNLSGKTVLQASPAYIHSNGDKYQILAIPLSPVDSSLQRKDSVNRIIEWKSDDGFIYQECTMKLDVGVKYRVYVITIFDNNLSSKKELTSGVYTSQYGAQDVGYPILVKHPYISDVDASVAASPSENGFIIEVSGWEDAETYEMAWTTDENGVDFTAETKNYSSVITASKKHEVASPESATYKVKVRPLISGFQVQTPKTTTVVSGSGGVYPESQVIAQFEKWIHTALVTVTNVTNNTANNKIGEYELTIGTLKFGYDHALTLDSRISYFQKMQGHIIVDNNGNPFEIVDLAASTDGLTAILQVERLPGETDAPITGQAKIGYGHEAARVLAELQDLAIDYDITDVKWDTKYFYKPAVDKNPVIGVWQRNANTSKDAKSISAKGKGVLTSNLKVRASAATDSRRDVVIDLDPPDADEDKARVAISLWVTVYGIPRTS